MQKKKPDHCKLFFVLHGLMLDTKLGEMQIKGLLTGNL